MKQAQAGRALGRLQEEAAGARTATLYERHARAVYGLCRLLLRDPHEAEDAAQTAFLAAYRAVVGGVEPRDPGAWLAAIARNECRSRIRARMREPVSVDDQALSRFVAPGADPADRFVSPTVAKALAALPERQREAVVLHDAFGLRAREVATALGVSLPATEALLFRARRQLRVRLRPVTGALAFPLGLRDALAQVIPGFADPAAGGAIVAGTAGAGILAKLAGAPAAAKIAAATVAVSAAGSVAVVGSERAGDVGAISKRVATIGAHAQSAPAGPIAAETAGAAGEVAERSSRRSGSGGDSDDDDAGRAGPGGGTDPDESSGSNRDESPVSAEPAGAGREPDDEADEADEDAGSSGPSGPAPGGSDSPDDDAASSGTGSGSGAESSDSSGPGSSSSGSGSSDEPEEPEEPEEPDEPEEERSGSDSGSDD